MADNAVGIAFTSEHKWHDGKATAGFAQEGGMSEFVGKLGSKRRSVTRVTGYRRRGRAMCGVAGGPAVPHSPVAKLQAQIVALKQGYDCLLATCRA